jgi:hypothetical protein
MGDTEVAESASTGPDGRPPKSSAAWVGNLIFVFFILFLIIYDAQAAYRHDWAYVAGITVFTLLFLTVPTGAAKRVLRVLRDRTQ